MYWAINYRKTSTEVEIVSWWNACFALLAFHKVNDWDLRISGRIEETTEMFTKSSKNNKQNQKHPKHTNNTKKTNLESRMPKPCPTRPRSLATHSRPTRDPLATHLRPTRDPLATHLRPTCDPLPTHSRPTFLFNWLCLALCDDSDHFFFNLRFSRARASFVCRKALFHMFVQFFLCFLDAVKDFTCQCT